MSIAFKIFKRLLVSLFMLIIIAVVAFLLWRIGSSGTPKSMEGIVPDSTLSELYAQSGELNMFKQDQRSITSSEKSYGYFAITDYTIIPDADQIQTAVRYNNSTLQHTAEDFGLDAPPSREQDVYDVTLLIAIDATPENKDDNLGNDPNGVRFVRCHGKTVASEQKNLYNFRKIVFDLSEAQIDLSELIEQELLLAIYADFYYVGALDYSAEPYGTLCLYDFKSENVALKLSRKDKEALEQFK